jgi:hypothetical protein
MDKERKLLIAGNWKMNKTAAEALDLVSGLKRELSAVKEVDIVVCPPFTALAEVSKAILDSNFRLGAQNMNENNYGAYTGEIAAGMLPCQWGYDDCGRHLAENMTAKPDSLHARWIAGYTDPEYRQLTEWLVGFTDRMAEQAGPAERERMSRLFGESLRHEYMFWNAAWTLQQWPVSM